MDALNTLRSRVKHGGSRGDPSIGLMAGETAGPDSSHEAVQVEPKTYFANERTFIQWISAALLLLTVSSIMMGSGEYNGTSSVIAFCALILVAYAAFVYFRRVRLLQTGEAYGYLDFLGPSILAAGVGLGVLIVFADAVKGSEFLPWGDGDGRRLATTGSTYMHSRHLVEQVYLSPLEETTGVCHQHSLQGLNILEYQPQDIVVADPAASNNNMMVVVATPQSLVAHFTNGSPPIVLADEIFNVELASIVSMPSRKTLLALSTGPTVTELIQFSMVSDTRAELVSRHVLEETATTQGSMVLLPETEKLLVSLDGHFYTYQMPGEDDDTEESPSTSRRRRRPLIRTSTLNTKVLDQGSVRNDPITAMAHVDGITYLLRSESNTLQAWDIPKATLVDEISLPTIASHDQWAGLALQVVEELPTISSNLRSSSSSRNQTTSRMVLHMPLDSYPPQLWTFTLQQNNGSFSLAPCDGSTTASN